MLFMVSCVFLVMKVEEIVRDLTPLSFLLIYSFATPENSYFQLIIRIFFASLISLSIFSWLSYWWLKKNSLMISVPYYSIILVTIFAIPIGLLYFGYSFTFVASVFFNVATLLMDGMIFVFLSGSIIWGIEIGKKVFLRNHENPIPRKKGKLRRKNRDLYPEAYSD